MQEITIIQEPTAEKPFCIVSKPRGLPSAPLSADDFQNCFCRAAAVFPELKAVSGRKAVERGLLHRLDTETEGLLLIAQTQEFYDFMIEEQKNGAVIILWTCRARRMLKDAVSWAEKQGLIFDYVNRNVPERIRAFKNDSRKISADVYVDDRAAAFSFGQKLNLGGENDE